MSEVAQAPAPPRAWVRPVVVGVVALALVAVGALWLFARFATMPLRSKQQECRRALREIAIAERAYYADRNAYTTDLAALGVRIERGNRYTYRLAAGPLEDRSRDTVVAAAGTVVGVGSDGRFSSLLPLSRELPARFAGDVTLGLSGTCPDCRLTAACVGQLDNDPAPDVWSVSTAPRRLDDGVEIPAFEPFCESDDAAFGDQQ